MLMRSTSSLLPPDTNHAGEHLQHINPVHMMQSMTHHHWLGCDIVLTDAGFHQIQDRLTHESWWPSTTTQRLHSSPTTQRCAGIHTAVV